MEFNATFIVSAISFILFTLIMNKIFYKPLDRIMTERQSYIDDTLSNAKYSNEKTQAILKDRDEKLQKAVLQSKSIISDKTTEANNNASEIIKLAKEKSAHDILNAKENLKAQAAELNENLEPQVKILAGIITSKLLGKNTQIEDSL